MIPDPNFHFQDPKTKETGKHLIQRLIEMIPGLLTGGTLLGVIFLSLFLPLWAAVFIIVFDVYWIYRAFYISLFAVEAQFAIARGKRIDWEERYRESQYPAEYVQKLEAKLEMLRRERRALSWAALKQRRKISQALRRTKEILYETRALIPVTDKIMDWRDVIHVVLLPTAGEPVEVIEPALESLKNAHFPREQMIILLATEEREDPETRLPKVKALQEKFGGVFRDFLVTTHIVAAGEMKCKASNAGFAARELMKYLYEKGIDYKRVVFSNFDCDSVVHPEYFEH